jgi:hypothetical protein
MKANKTMRGQYQTTGKDKESESGIDSAAHNQIHKKQLNGRNHHIPININSECQQTQLPI